jgi:hypothetical protein
MYRVNELYQTANSEIIKMKMELATILAFLGSSVEPRLVDLGEETANIFLEVLVRQLRAGGTEIYIPTTTH